MSGVDDRTSWARCLGSSNFRGRGDRRAGRGRGKPKANRRGNSGRPRREDGRRRPNRFWHRGFRSRSGDADLLCARLRHRPQPAAHGGWLRWRAAVTGCGYHICYAANNARHDDHLHAYPVGYGLLGHQAGNCRPDADRTSARGVPAAGPHRGCAGLDPRRHHKPDTGRRPRCIGCADAGRLPQAE